MKIEALYMRQNRLEYSKVRIKKHKGWDKSCLSVLVSKVKSEIVNGFQKSLREKQGVNFSIELGKDELGRRLRRKQGIFYDKFVKYDSDFEKQESDESEDEIRIQKKGGKEVKKQT